MSSPVFRSYGPGVAGTVRGGRFAPSYFLGAVVADGASPAGPFVGTVTSFTSLALNSASSGTKPYSATVLPLRGQVPAGQSLVSTDDATLSASILSTWDDGSAAVIVASGSVSLSAGVPKTIGLQVGTSAGSALTAAAISAQVSSVSVAFGATHGTATISSFGSPERIWWANARSICARYRASAPTTAGSQLQIVVDIQAWADRALVEIVCENGLLTSANANPAKPGAATYTGAVVSINGTAVATRDATGVSGETGHNAFRAWYASGWTGAGDPGVVAHQAVADLQLHPLLFKMDQACTADLSGYAADTYAPWANGRHAAANMGGVGDQPWIGPLTLWDAQWLQSGDTRAANAVQVQALNILAYNVGYRESSTGLVPTITEVDQKSQNGSGTWPDTGNPSGPLAFEINHHPAVGLAAFCVRPSPVFIEIAQKVSLWCATWQTNFDGVVRPTGVYMGDTVARGKAWALRSLAHATFLTPDAMAWKAAGRTSLLANLTYLDQYRASPLSKLNIIWEGQPDAPGTTDYNVATDGPAFAVRGWMVHYFITEIHKIAAARLLTGADQLAMDRFADWAAGFPVRWVNEQADGGWRYIPYSTVIGRAADASINMPDSWALIRNYVHSDSPPALTGTWYFGTGNVLAYATDYGNTDPAIPIYTHYFWAALVAAVERSIPGAAQAWWTVANGITNLTTWRAAFGGEPRWGSVPKVIPAAAGWAAGASAGSYNGATYTWTPAVTGGVVNLASWAIVPKSTIVQVAGSNLDAVDASVRAAVPSWSTAQLNWNGLTETWAGLALDPGNSRLWAFGGGHTNGFNNALVRFDTFRMAWAVECMPTDRAAWPGTYTGGSSSTEYPPAADAFQADYLASTWQPINGTFYDQLQDNNPTARHTYQSLVYDASRNRLMMACRRFWAYDITAGAWTYRRAVLDLPDGGRGPTYGTYPWLDAENSGATYDERTDEYLTWAIGSGNHGAPVRYSLASSSWSTSFPNATWASTIVYPCRRGRDLVLISPRVDGLHYWVHNLDTHTNSASDVAAARAVDFGATYWQWTSAALPPEWSIEWVASLERFWVCSYNAANAWEIVELDPTTTPWTLRKLTLPGVMPTQPFTLVRRLNYMPNINAVVLMGYASVPLAVIRL